jgi:ArsR family transcriptional regulator
MDESNAIQALSALSQATRLRSYRALVQAGPEGRTPTDLGALLAISATTLSFHLKELHRAGLITQERDVRHLIYRADFARMNALLGYLTEHCCEGQACELTPNPNVQCTTC